jgi:protein tyrosine phosphatase (PTP) superfamily phosphohydrolase (DUF442 family)
MKKFWLLPVALILGSTISFAAAITQQSERPRSDQVEQLIKIDAPVVLCIDDKPVAGGQPSGQAYARAAASGYRSVLTLRSDKDGVDPLRERLLVEQQKMRYFNLPATTKLPRVEQVDEFLGLVRDSANHPMLINCAFAERVAPLMMIFRITDQGWSKERAIEEASKSGLKGDQLEKFAKDYLAPRKKKQTNSRRRANPS